MKILFLNPVAGLGGAERVLLDMVAGLSESMPAPEMTAILGDEGPLCEKLQALGVSVIVSAFPAGLAKLGDAAAGGPAGGSVNSWSLMLKLGASSPSIASYARALRRTISEIAPDVVHSNGFKMHLMAAWATPASTPIVWHVHDFLGHRPVMSRLIRMNVRRCAAIIANSNSVAADARSVLGPEVRISTVYNAVDLSRFTLDGPRLDLDALAGLPAAPSNVVRVGIVATMARWKGHEVFLRALSMLPAANVRGYIIGGPVYSTAGSQHTIDELRQMSSAFGLDGRVGFTGFVQNSAHAIRALDIVVHASTAPEPFGLAVAEAQACGKAVVVSRAGGVMEIVHEGRDALAHKPGDASQLAGEVGRLAADEGLRKTLGITARANAEKMFARARMTSELSQVYRSLYQAEYVREQSSL